jgi:acetyl-CoA carboxylase biotin carboxyl carrier protein
VDLTSDDVQDILHVLDGLPFGELHLETARFRLSLRRTGNGEWTQEMQVLTAPNVLPAEAGTAASAPGAARTAPSAQEPSAQEPSAQGPSAQGPSAQGPSAQGPSAQGPSAQGPSAQGPSAQGPSGPAPSVPGDRLERGLTEVRAPLLGTFYRAPRPGAPPYVNVGSPVEQDTVVGIIETMKLMNSVSAGVSGTVAEILLANAQFAEQGAVLMRIREDG